ncbi:MAG: hypothetical protein H7067_06025, partial [Burkholderiales bacterium]|nr:hypothetical protein [Opitutaceae bacterium]
MIAAGWETDARPEHAAFRDWTHTHAAAAPDGSAGLIAEGLRLADARRVALARLIVTDPEAALASAVPLAVRAGLPAEVVSRLETRVSGRGELSLNAVTPAPGGPRPSEPVFRSALIDGVEYRAHVYGRRADQLTVPDAALVGIAVDRELAVAASPVRVLEPGEVDANRPRVNTCAACAATPRSASATSVAYEYAGRVGVAENAAHFISDVAALEAAERDFSEPVNAADNQPGTSTTVGRPTRAWTHGTKSVLIIRVDFPDRPGVPLDGPDELPITDAYAVDVFTRPDGAVDFIADSSFGKSSLAIRPAVAGDSPDVTAVLRLPKNSVAYAVAGDNATLHADARAAALKAGINIDAYDRIGVVFSNLSAIPDSRIVYGGLGNIAGRFFWINGAYSFRVITHELGHTYGIRHANLWKVEDGDPVSENGFSFEYGDPFDIMGGGVGFVSTDDFSHWNKSLLQWIPDDAVTVAESAGTFRVYRFDDGTADLGLPRALKIVRDPDRDYWIGYRRGTENASLDGGAYVLWGYNRNTTGDLLDLATPGADPFDAGLRVGQTFHDSAAGITLLPVAQGGSGAEEWLDVQVTFAPRIHWVSSVVLADEERGSVTLKLRRTGSSSGAFSAHYTTEAGVAFATTDFAPTTGTVTWADGDMADKTITIPLVADGFVEGSETFFVRIDSVTGGVRVGPASASVTVADPGARDTTYLADFFNNAIERVVPRADGGALVAGTFFTVGFERRSGVARLGADGLLDPDFAPGGGTSKVGSIFAQVSEVALQPDGRILIIGDFDAYDGVARPGFARLQPDGTLDTAFQPSVNGRVRAIVPLPDGRLLVGGDFTRIGGVAREYLARLHPDGSVDTSFVGPDFADATSWGVYGLAVQPDGKALVAGLFYFPGTNRKSGLCRVQTDGTLDASFSGVVQGAHVPGKTSTLKVVRSIIVQPDGQILISGDFGAFNNSPRSGLARLTASGALDTGFAPTVDGVFGLKTMLRQPDGRLLIGGDFTKVNGVSAPHLARLFTNGTLDTAFAAPGRPSAEVRDLALAVDGRLYFAGLYGKFQTEDLSSLLWRALPGVAETAGAVEFSADTYIGREGSTATLIVHRVGGAAGTIRVGYSTARDAAGDTATATADYTRDSGVLEWADGDSSDKMIRIPITADGLSDEPETFTVRLGEPMVGGVLPGARVEAVVTILAGVVSPQSITFPAPANRTFGDAPFTLAATADSGLPVGFTVVSGPATLAGSLLSLTGAGTVTVRATQPGDAVFTAAAPIDRSITLARAPQTITFAALPNRRLADGAFTLAATSDAGLPVAFELVSGMATLTGAMLTPTALGEVVVRARQDGDTNFLPASSERGFHVSVSASVLLSGLSQTYDDAPRIVTATTTPPGLPVVVTYNGSTTPPTAAGSYQVLATASDPAGVGSATGTLVVEKATVTASVPSQDILLGTAAKPLVIGYAGLRGDDSVAGLARLPTASHKVTTKSKPGVYPIALVGGLDANYAFALVPGTIRVVSLAGSYETLLRASPDAPPSGLLRITVAASQKTFSGYLEHDAETARLTLSGTLASATGSPDDVLGVATIKRTPNGVTAYSYRIDIAPMRTSMAAELLRDGVRVSSGSGPLLNLATSKARPAFVGRYTLRLLDVAPLDPEEARPFAPGTGHAVGSGTANGTLALAGNFPDGSKLTLSLPAAALEDGDYRYFVRPNGARASSYAAGRITDPRFALAPPEGGDAFVWRKAKSPLLTTTEFFKDGFALAGRHELRRWSPPVVAVPTKGILAIPLAARLGLNPADMGEFTITHQDAELGGSGGTLPATAVLGVNNKVTVATA